MNRFKYSPVACNTSGAAMLFFATSSIMTPRSQVQRPRQSGAGKYKNGPTGLLKHVGPFVFYQ